mmetsp:Transcript_35030/g.90777  ORF Transcript_35030/g.90777 Transcript_35030/m.90777 type:complete len:216 (-) Transcript_35030:838-1485(-)
MRGRKMSSTRHQSAKRCKQKAAGRRLDRASVKTAAVERGRREEKRERRIEERWAARRVTTRKGRVKAGQDGRQVEVRQVWKMVRWGGGTKRGRVSHHAVAYCHRAVVKLVWGWKTRGMILLLSHSSMAVAESMWEGEMGKRRGKAEKRWKKEGSACEVLVEASARTCWLGKILPSQSQAKWRTRAAARPPLPFSAVLFRHLALLRAGVSEVEGRR